MLWYVYIYVPPWFLLKYIVVILYVHVICYGWTTSVMLWLGVFDSCVDYRSWAISPAGSKDYETCICCFTTKYPAELRKQHSAERATRPVDSESEYYVRVERHVYFFGICCFSAKHAALRRKSKDWLARNQDNMYEWDDTSISGLFFQWSSTIKVQVSMHVGLDKSGHRRYFFEIHLDTAEKMFSWSLTATTLHSLYVLVYLLDRSNTK